MKTLFIFLFVILLPFSLQAKNLQATQQAANSGEARAQYDLGIHYLKGDGVEKDSKSAIKWLKKSAGQDFVSAQYKLGLLYREGRKVGTDMDQAIEYFMMAADHGNASAQYMLGDIYQQGDGVEKDLEEAREWFELAAGHKFQKAQNALRLLAKTEENTAASLAISPKGKIEKVKKKPDSQPVDETPQSAYELGMKYLRGAGVSRSYKTAAKWFSQAAEQGHAESQYQLGELLKKGRGAKRNKKLANKWYRAAAKQGHIKAKKRLDGCDFC